MASGGRGRRLRWGGRRHGEIKELHAGKGRGKAVAGGVIPGKGKRGELGREGGRELGRRLARQTEEEANRGGKKAGHWGRAGWACWEGNVWVGIYSRGGRSCPCPSTIPVFFFCSTVPPHHQGAGRRWRHGGMGQKGKGNLGHRHGGRSGHGPGGVGQGEGWVRGQGPGRQAGTGG